MDKSSTKDQILEVALDLFSVRGFEETSISQIADAVGIRKASLYSHFSSKQDILDTLMGEITDEFNKNSVLVNTKWDDPVISKRKSNWTIDGMADMVKGQIRYIIHDPKVSRVRKMLTIEQYRNGELKMAAIKQFYEDIFNYNIGLMRYLISNNVLAGEDPEIMAAQYAWPISIWTGVVDREPEREDEVMGLIDRHIRQFFQIYKK